MTWLFLGLFDSLLLSSELFWVQLYQRMESKEILGHLKLACRGDTMSLFYVLVNNAFILLFHNWVVVVHINRQITSLAGVPSNFFILWLLFWMKSGFYLNRKSKKYFCIALHFGES